MSGKKGKGGKKGENAPRPVIIKRYENVEAGHHGGAWKVAYADFVTAMMAFFLLMWLLNATTDAQKRGIADYFSPISAISTGKSGTGKPFGGSSPNTEGAMVSQLGSVSILQSVKPPNDSSTDDDTPKTQPQRTSDAGQGAGAEDSDNPGRGPTGEAMAGSEHEGDQASGEALSGASATAAAGEQAVQAGEIPLGGNQATPTQATPTQKLSQPAPPAASPPSTADTQKSASGSGAPGSGASASNPSAAQGSPAQGSAAQGSAAQGSAAQGSAAQGQAQMAAMQPPSPPPGPPPGSPRTPEQEQAAFKVTAQQIREAVAHDPNLADIAKQLSIDITPDGLRIQLLDEEKRPMFQLGSSAINDRARTLLQKVAPALTKLTEDISVTGHTDATPFPSTTRTNWELSTERAMATRRLLSDAGLPIGRFRSISGDADRDPLLPADPFAAANRRIAIVVLRQLPVPPTRVSEPLTPEGAEAAARTLAPAAALPPSRIPPTAPAPAPATAPASGSPPAARPAR